MSDKPPITGATNSTLEAATIDAAGQIDIRAELTRLDRDRAQTQVFIAEQRALMAETDKLMAEERKLAGENAKLWAEAFKLDRETRLAPWVIVSTIAGSLTTGLIVAVLSHLWK
jgi:hypothetical protein